MKNAKQGRLIDLAMAAAVTVIVPVIAMLGWPFLSEKWAPSPKGEILLYEIDPTALTQSSVDTAQLTKTIDRRINSGDRNVAEVRLLADGRVEVAMLRENKDEQQEVERILSNATILEFRILANKHYDQALIERASSDPSAVNVVNKNGELLGRWVRVNAVARKGLKEYDDIVLRTKKQGEVEHAEVLVVQDPINVTGAYLTEAKNGFDRLGRPELSLSFNTKGGRLLQNLTSSHLPDHKIDLIYKLGIIVNDELYFAPGIVNKIYTCANIATATSIQDLKALTESLNSRCIAARVRLVEKKPRPSP
jgi:preprotein translocase subunit SecD